MICDKCLEESHYWFAWENIDGEDEDLIAHLGIGKYAWCDMREVFDTRTGCECGCHQKKYMPIKV